MIQNSNPTKKNVTYIDTQITEDGVISFENDGNGVTSSTPNTISGFQR
jgi:hypothetical protein